MPYPPRPLADRLWEKVDKSAGPTGCWLWTGKLTSSGYGGIGAGGKYGRTLSPHRVAYELEVGPIPEGFVIDHMCHEKRCVNPAHLQAVTQQANNHNRRGAMRRSRTGVRGVTWNKRTQTWVVRAHVNGVTHYGRSCKSLKEAEQEAIALRNRLMTNNLADRRTHAR